MAGSPAREEGDLKATMRLFLRVFNPIRDPRSTHAFRGPSRPGPDAPLRAPTKPFAAKRNFPRSTSPDLWRAWLRANRGRQTHEPPESGSRFVESRPERRSG